MTLLFTDPFFQQHETGHHPERPARLIAVQERLEKVGLITQCQKGVSSPVTDQAIETIHTASVIAKVRQLAERGGGWLEADTYISPESYRVACAAAGACVSAVDQVLHGQDHTAFCVVRPPGHHATKGQSMGFCLFNNIALAAEHARRQFGLQRILIVDWDVHHGNGTQEIFWNDAQVFFLSIHRYGAGFYPGTGAADETGSGAGLGATLNVPLRFDTPQADYLAQFRGAIERAAEQSKPELILLSAGFDAHRRDPVGALCLQAEDFAEMTRLLRAVAQTHAQGRLVSCLEGGYDLEALAECAQAHLEALLRPA